MEQRTIGGSRGVPDECARIVHAQQKRRETWGVAPESRRVDLLTDALIARPLTPLQCS